MRALVCVGTFMMVMAALAHFGVLRIVANLAAGGEDRSSAYAAEAVSQSLLLFFFAYVAARVRAKLRRPIDVDE